jgi:hypothetical protein
VRWLLGVPCVHLGPLALDNVDFVARLARALSEHRVDALTCVSEPISVALWDCRDQLPARVRLVSVRPEQARVLASKWFQLELARSCGLQTLPAWRFAPGETARAGDVPIDAFPLVLRPDIATQANPPFKLRVVDSADALRVCLDALVPGSSPVVAQPLVTGPNLLVHGWRAADGRWGGHVAFRVEVKHGGLTVLMRPVELPAEVARGCREMESQLRLTGVFHHEFILDEARGLCCHLDLNPRLGGTTGKALAAGYDEPLALVATLQAEPMPRLRFLRTLRPAGALHQAARALLAALRGSSTSADYPYPDRRLVVRRLLGFAFSGSDELLRLAALRSLLGFGLYQVMGRWRRG